MSLIELEKFADDSEFLLALQKIKLQAKEHLAFCLRELSMGIDDCSVIFDVQSARFTLISDSLACLIYPCTDIYRLNQENP
jgi:glucan phosphorylase